MGESTTQGHKLAHQMAQAQSAPMPPQQPSSSSSHLTAEQLHIAMQIPERKVPVVTQPQQQIMGEAETKSRRGRHPGVKQTIGDKPTRDKSRPKNKQLP